MILLQHFIISLLVRIVILVFIRQVFREGRTKAVGHVVKVIPMTSSIPSGGSGKAKIIKNAPKSSNQGQGQRRPERSATEGSSTTPSQGQGSISNGTGSGRKRRNTQERRDSGSSQPDTSLNSQSHEPGRNPPGSIS